MSEDTSHSQRSSPRQSILLIGDLPVHRIPLSQILSAYGFSVVVLDQGNLVSNFLEHRASSILLILLNLNHPSAGGLDLAREVVKLAQPSGTPVAGIYNSLNLTPRHLEKAGIPVAIDAFSLPEEIVDIINRVLFRGRDSRKQVRIFVYLPATYHMDGRDVACRVTSLSLGGIFLQTEIIQKEETQIGFTIQIRAEQKVAGNGTVVYTLLQQAVGDVVKVSGMGVRFDRLDPEGAKHLGAFYRQHLERYMPKGPEQAEKTPTW